MEYQRLLQRQIKKYLRDKGVEEIPEYLNDFLSAVNQSYEDHERDLNLLERSMEISSKELLEVNIDLNAVFQAIPDLVFKINSQGVILDSKTKHVHHFNLLPKDVMGRKMQDVLSIKSQQRLEETLKEVKRNQTVAHIECFISDGVQTETYESRVVCLDAEHYIVITRDITEQKKSEEEKNEVLDNLKQFQKVSVGRELRMIELKKEVNRMAKEMGKEAPYDLSRLE